MERLQRITLDDNTLRVQLDGGGAEIGFPKSCPADVAILQIRNLAEMLERGLLLRERRDMAHTQLAPPAGAA